MKKFLITMMMIALIPAAGYAAKIKEGSALPKLKIKGDDAGIMQTGGEDFKKFDSSKLKGKVRSILVLAAIKDNDLVNKPFVDALKAAKFPIETYQTVSIIDFDQANFITRPIGKSKSRDKQVEFPDSMYVWDQDGDTLEKWGLKEESYSVIVIDKNNKVLKFKDGKLSDAEIKDFIQAIKENM